MARKESLKGRFARSAKSTLWVDDLGGSNNNPNNEKKYMDMVMDGPHWTKLTGFQPNKGEYIYPKKSKISPDTRYKPTAEEYWKKYMLGEDNNWYKELKRK